jgi:hypothetical protein
VAQEKLNLLQLASTVVAQFSARPAKIAGRHVLKPQFEAVAPHNAPDEVLADAATPHTTRPVDTLYAANASRQFRAQQAAICGFISESPNGCQPLVDGGGRQAASFQVHPIADQHDRLSASAALLNRIGDGGLRQKRDYAIVATQ